MAEKFNKRIKWVSEMRKRELEWMAILVYICLGNVHNPLLRIQSHLFRTVSDHKANLGRLSEIFKIFLDMIWLYTITLSTIPKIFSSET